MKIILLPGWHEVADLMETFANGRHGRYGFSAYGFDSIVFPQGKLGLRNRVDEFAHFLDRLKAREPEAFPVAIFGFSAGGLIARGFLRAYPERAAEIAGVVQLATPNGGLITNYLVQTMQQLHIREEELADLDVASSFMTWLNGTSGHWIPTQDPKHKMWVLDRKPWVVPDGTRILAIVGRVARFAGPTASDGVVRSESCHLEEHIPTIFIDDDRANHLNMGAIWNPFTSLFRGFVQDDSMWPRVVEYTVNFLKPEHSP